MSSNNAEIELIARIIEITGTSQAEAQHLLSACANDVEAAVALYFEQGAGAEDAQVAATAANSVAAAMPVDDAGGEDDVRAPIPPMREQLIGPEDDNFLATAPSHRLSRITQRVKICPLRDFAREGALMEEQLQLQGNDAGVHTAGVDNFGRRRRARAAAMVTAAQGLEEPSKPTSSRLTDLFRPPTDITYAGTFQTSRNRATELKQWLLVNVQSDNFDSQLLNRDVWSNKELRKLINRQFLLWQPDADSSEGRRFVAFYHCSKLPYVCVIDPRTGEEVWKCAEPKESTLLPDLKKFLLEHKDFSKELEEDAPSTSKRLTTECITIIDDNEDADDEQHNKANVKKRTKLMELSEEEQIALAIRNSMRENGVKSNNTNGAKHKNTNGDSDSDDDVDDNDNDAISDGFNSLEEFDENDVKTACERTSYEENLGKAITELTALKLRLFNAEGAEEVVQLRWPSDTRLQVLRQYINQQQQHIPKEGYKLICAFPRKALEAENDAFTLKELGLHPSANLHLTLDD